MKSGREAAVRGGEKLLESPRVRVVHINEELQEASWRIFRKVEHKNISFVDCSTIAVMKVEDIARLLTFDTEDFGKLQKHYRFSLYP